MDGIVKSYTKPTVSIGSAAMRRVLKCTLLFRSGLQIQRREIIANAIGVRCSDLVNGASSKIISRISQKTMYNSFAIV